MDFHVVTDEVLRTVICTIASATVIEAGDVCEGGTGIPVKGTASGAALAYSPFACAAGDTQIELTTGNDFVLEGTAENVFAVSQQGTEVDLVISGSTQLIDNNASVTDVFKMDISENGGTVGSTAKVRVRINKPLF